MKRKNIIIIIVLFGVSFVSFAFCMSMLLFPNIKSDYPTLDEFQKVMEDYNCKVNIENENQGISYFYETTNMCEYDMKLIVFSDDKIRDKYFNDFLIDVKDNGKIRGGETININIGTLLIGKDTNGDNYKSVLLKNESILYLNTSMENREKALQIKRVLGYKYEPNWENIKYFIIPVIIFIFGIIYVAFILLKEVYLRKKNKKLLTKV